MSQPKSALIIVCDRLGAGFVGPYGNTWLETPCWNRIACEGLLVENHFADSGDLAQIYRSYWTGQPAWRPDEALVPSLPAVARAAGLKAVLITDEPLLINHPLTADFDEVIALPPGETITREMLEQTAAAQVLDEAYDWLQRAEHPFLLWVHAQALAGPWDAPYELRADLADETDPPPPAIVHPPEVHFQEETDPDLLLGYQQAYGGQVRALDACLAPLWTLREDIPALKDALWLLTSPRGYPLGEHGRVGNCEQALFGELLHTPLVLSLPGGVSELTRTTTFSQPFDLYAAICEGAEWTPTVNSHLIAYAREIDVPPRMWAAANGPRERGLRTLAWYLREKELDGEIHRQLYAKPDDRWEANEVATRCVEIGDLMSATLRDLLARKDLVADIPAALANGWR